MKIKTSELTGYALGWAVSLITNPDWEHDDRLGNVQCLDEDSYDPQDNWAQGGPIIEREGITVSPYSDDKFNNDGVEWLAILTDPEAFVGTNEYDTVFELCGQFTSRGLTPLIAAMCCFVASKLGDEIEIPEELWATGQ